MNRKLNKMHCLLVGIISFAVMIAALIQIPRLSDINTCVSAAFIITGAYAWFAAIIWANIVMPMLNERGK